MVPLNVLPPFSDGISPASLPITVPDPSLDSYAELLSPGSVHIRLSADCNLSCSFCEREAWKDGTKLAEENMPLDVWQAIYEKIVPHVSGVEVCGLGEPTLSPLFPRVCKDILDAGKVLYFPTNGSTLGSKKILDCIGQTPRVSVSLDAWDADSYKAVRGGDWDQVIKAVTKFRKAKPKAFLHSQFTASTKNIDGFPSFMRVAASLGIQEVTWRMVQNHATAREDLSLRFAKSRTEGALAAAHAVAVDAGINLIVERREYSEFNADSMEDTSPEARLKRYLDFAPMSGPTCPPICSTYFTGGDGTVTTGSFSTNISFNGWNDGVHGAFGGTGTQSSGTVVCGNCTTYSYWQTVSMGIGDRASWTQNGTLQFASTTCTSITETEVTGTSGTGTVYYITCTSHISNGSTNATFSTILAWGPAWPANPLGGPESSSTSQSSSTAYCATNSFIVTCPPNTTYTVFTCLGPQTDPFGNTTCIPGALTDQIVSWDCTGTCSFKTTFHSGTGFQTDPGQYCNGIYTSAGEGDAPTIIPTLGVIRGVTAERGGVPVEQAMTDTSPVDAKPVVQTQAAIIAWANGELTTCFAKHVVGNVLTDAWADVLVNPRYQAFLHRREAGHISEESWCQNCARTF